MDTDGDWYYVDAGMQQAGPADVNALRNLFSSNVINEQTLVWKDGMPNWLPVADIPALKVRISPMRRISARNMAPPPPGHTRDRSSSRAGYGQAPGLASNKPTNMNNTYNNNNNNNVHMGGKQTGGRSMARASMSRNWVEKYTADQVPYFYNPSTDSVTWERPDCLKTNEQRENDSGEWVWVSDEVEGWVPARKTGGSGASVKVTLRDGQKRTVNGNKEPLWPLKLSSLRHLEEDLVMVDSINQGLMMHCLKERYRHDEIYTWVGAGHTVLVSVNPFKQLPIYTVDLMNNFAIPSPNRLLPPHTFAIANNAYKKLRIEAENQAILISGESGAGKTEATKQCLNYLAEIAGSDSNVEQKILNANPILEAFGNAKTLRNNNSSRFGRWMEIHFDPRGGIVGCKIENYLLEKSRVVYQSQGERSYHIFYQLCQSSMSQALGLGDPEMFNLLAQSGCTTVPGIDDIEDFNDVQNAFSNLNFSEDEYMWFYEVCAGVLYLGNVSFVSDGGEGSYVDQQTQAWLDGAAGLLHVDSNTLAHSLTHRSIEIRGEVTHILHKVNEAHEAKEALAKHVYGRMFDYLVLRINDSLEGKRGSFIGVLDIFGFEIFETNSFEQLCINFTNEKLQQHFNRHTFKEEESVYQSEGIRYDPIVFIDNQPVLDLIEKKPYGLLNLLDEEVRLPKGSDAKWLNKCESQHVRDKPWVTDSSVRMNHSANAFAVAHYAGIVAYDSTGFVDKNKDALFRDLYDLLTNSSNQYMRQRFPPKDKNPRRVQTLGGQFRGQLNNLMNTVDRTEPYYIRCIKPNHEKRANYFHTKMCIEQLTYAGVFEAVKIRKQGFPFRLTHKRFANRYRPLLRKEAGWVNINARPGDYRTMCSEIMNNVNQDFSQVQIGQTMVLYRSDEHRILELLRNLSLERVLPACQRTARRYIGRRFLSYLRQAKSVLSEAHLHTNDWNYLDSVIQQASDILAPVMPIYQYEPYELVYYRDLRFKLQERVELSVLLKELIHKDPKVYYEEYVAAVARCDKVADMPGTAEDQQIEQQIRAALAAVAGERIDPWAREALYLLDKEQMQEVIDEAARFNYDTEDLQDIRKKLALSEEEFVKLQLKRANELNDPDRIINREIRLKEMYLNAHGAMFAIPRYGPLRDPYDWAGLKFFGLARNKSDMAKDFLSYTTKPIHASLTQVDSTATSKLAVRQFKNLMGFMGDRKYQYPDTLMQEVLANGLKYPDLRGELYLQLIKQLTNNPNQASVSKGWDVMALFLSCFPPPPEFENYLAMFLRHNASQDKLKVFTGAMYQVIYGGARSNPLSLNEIPVTLSEFFQRPITKRYQVDDLITARPAAPQTNNNNNNYYGSSSSSSSSSTGYGANQNNNNVGVRGMAPPPPKPQPSEPTAIVLYDYSSGGQEGMLDIRKGDLLKILNKDDADWWQADKNGQAGWVPANYVEIRN